MLFVAIFSAPSQMGPTAASGGGCGNRQRSPEKEEGEAADNSHRRPVDLSKFICSSADCQGTKLSRSRE